MCSVKFEELAFLPGLGGLAGQPGGGIRINDLRPESQAFLRGLPLQAQVEECLAVHSDYVLERDFPSFFLDP